MPHTYLCVACIDAYFISVVHGRPLLRTPSPLAQVLATPLNKSLGLNKVHIPESLPEREFNLNSGKNNTSTSKANSLQYTSASRQKYEACDGPRALYFLQSAHDYFSGISLLSKQKPTTR